MQIGLRLVSFDHRNELTRDFRSSRCVEHFVISPNRLAATTLRLLCFLFSRVSLLAFSWLHLPRLWCIRTNVRANERSTAYSCSKESPGKYRVELCSTAALVSLVSVEDQNPSQLFATVETSEAIECVKSSMLMLVFCKLLKTC